MTNRHFFAILSARTSVNSMSGHSKWSTIKRQKAVTDSRRSAVFTKLGRLITVAAREGGGDPSMNFKLRLAIDKAKAANMPNDNIDRAIASGTGENKGAAMKEALYEGFGPGRVAVLVQTLSDNANRTSSEVRQIFQRHSGSLGTPNSVSWMFTLQGRTRIPHPADAESLVLEGIDVGVEDSVEEHDELILVSSTSALPAIQSWLSGKGIGITSSAPELIPTTFATPAEKELIQLHELFEELDDHPDVTSLTSNESE